MSSDLFRLDGKTALVTGGARGLGRMIAEGLLRAGASVTITARKSAAARQAVAEMSALGKCGAIAADLASPEGAVSLAERLRACSNRLDILVNNAGRTWGAPLESFPDEGWKSVLMVNVHMPFKLVQLLLPQLAASGSAEDPARIINVGSVAGKRIEPLRAYSYAASKAAIHQLSRQLAADLASRHITVNAILPGYFPTSMTAHLRDADGFVEPATLQHIPLRRLGRPDDIAGIVVFLSSRAGAYVTGAEIPVDGGIVGCN